MDQTIGMIIFLAVNLILAAGLGLLFGKTNILGEKSRLSKWLRYLIGIVAFGLLSVIGTATAATYDGALLNARDYGPVSGGLWFGPIVGIGAAVIGAAYRFTLGGITAVPCTIATLLAGIISGLIYVWCRKTGKQLSVWVAAIAMLVIEVIHLALVASMTEGGLAIVLGPTGIGTLTFGVVLVLVFSITYKMSSKKSEN
ncbi:MAG: LytS/YhcK type 5TM receptor domain-containing protein [Methanocorpusculum sp.]|nr:LytS/YhcK type 5TM receptor domain-containing protein [Methanocorpusculum sp.]